MLGLPTLTIKTQGILLYFHRFQFNAGRRNANSSLARPNLFRSILGFSIAAVRFNHHRYPVESVELIESDGDRINFTRGSDNRFVLDGGFPINGVQDLGVTDIFGQQVILDDINITGGADTEQITGEQFELI